MTRDARTISELRKAGIITGAEIAAAGTLYEVEPTGTYTFKSGHSLDLAEAVKAHPKTALALADPASSANFRRTMVATAIMQARPKAP